MKKIINLCALFMLLAATSCSSDDPVTTQTYTITTNNRSLTADASDDDVYFSQTTATLAFDLTNYTVSITSSALLDESKRSVSFTTPAMQLTATSNGIYTFTDKANATNGISGFHGYVNLSTGMTWFTYTVDDTYTIHTTSQLLYAYTTTTLNVDGTSPYSHAQSAYCFVMDETGESCTLQISNFIFDNTGTVQVEQVDYENLKVKVTATGYTVTGVEVMPTNGSERFKLYDVNFAINKQGCAMLGTYVCNDYNVLVRGTGFATDVNP